MKKEEKNKENVFNPADYDYIDNIPLDCWIWEFIRRDPEYINIYSKLKSTKVISGVFYSIEISVKTVNLLKLIHDEFCIQPNISDIKFLPDSQFVLIIKGKGSKKICLGLPSPFVKYKDFSLDRPIIVGATPVVSHKIDESVISKYEKATDKYYNNDKGNDEEFEEYGDKDFNKYCADLIEDTLSTNGMRNTLYLGISMKAKTEDIKREVDRIIKQYIKPSPVKFRPDKWKYYLIVYDLRKQDMSYETIEEILSNAYEEKEDVLDIENLKNYYKNALELITGGYKRYI